jgi:predicted kinase
MPKLIIVCGISFAGKTVLAGLLADHFGYVEVDVDETKDRLFGVAVSAVDNDQLSAADWARIYHETDALIGRHLQSGASVIDASRNFTRGERVHASCIAADHHAELITIHVATPVHVARQRLLANRRTKTRRDVTDAAFEELLSVWESPTVDESPLVLSFGESLATWMTKHANVLRSA